MAIARKIFLVLTLIILSETLLTAQLKYPVTKKMVQTDDYFGTKVEDPYRWLEDDKSAETKEWVTAENEVTQSFLSKIPYREKFQNAIEKFYNYPKYSAPFRTGEWFYFYKNDGLQNQSVLYRQKGLEGTPEVVINPNQLSPDGTTRLQLFKLSKDGRYAAVGLSKGGSDWQTFYVRDMQTGKNLPDELMWVKVSGAAWKGNGFYYSRYPTPVKGASDLSAKNENHKVYYHAVGTVQSEDILVYEDNNNPLRFNNAGTSEDERFLFLNTSDRGKGLAGNALFFKDLTLAPNAAFKPIVKDITNSTYRIVTNTASQFLLQTNEGAPNSKIIAVPVNNPDINKAIVIVPEKPEPLTGAGSAGGKLFVEYLKDVTSRTYVYDFKGRFIKEVKYPGLGSSGGLDGNDDDRFVFYVFNSFTVPPSIYKYDIATGTSTIFRKPEVSFKPGDYETKQVFYPTKDGTQIPMFIIYKKGLQLTGDNVTMLYGYGGFNINLEPVFSATLLPFLNAGGVYAQANLRGGGEYGEKWHKAGMTLNKQNVFDDFIAAGEYLVAHNYTSKKKLAIRGGSNGGLLVGAVINQRPDLFKVAIAQVGVMDMLRFQKFTIGFNWISDYGSSEKDEANFKNLYAFSPLQNIRAGVNYPAVLATTADHDDRVVPAHSFKYMATLQEKYKGTEPVLIRIDTNSGHGASNTKKNIETLADIYSFIFYNMGVTPKGFL